MSVADQLDVYVRAQLSKIRSGQSITLFNGMVYPFRTDAGKTVDKQMEYTEHPDLMPSIVFYTGQNTTIIDDTVELGQENHAQEVSIEGFIQCDKAGSEGDDLMLDISAAIKSDPWWGGMILELQNFKTDNVIQVGDVVFSIVKVSFTVLYAVPFGSE